MQPSKLRSTHKLLTSSAALAAIVLASTPSSAAIIGIEGFDYNDGPIAGQTGGTGWDYLRTAEPDAAPQSPSNWNNVTAEPQVQGGVLVTSGNSARREFGGLTEGSGAGSNEREGAFRGAGVVYFAVNWSVDTLLDEGATQWSGFSSYDFGAERIFFGLPGQATAARYLGVAGAVGGLTTIAVEAGVTYQLVGAVDFDADLVKLWVNPDAADFDNGATHSADLAVPYDGTNWSTAVRLGSGAGFTTTWDDLLVTDSFANIVVPEPATGVLAVLGLGLGVATRRARRGRP